MEKSTTNDQRSALSLSQVLEEELKQVEISRAERLEPSEQRNNRPRQPDWTRFFWGRHPQRHIQPWSPSRPGATWRTEQIRLPLDGIRRRVFRGLVDGVDATPGNRYSRNRKEARATCVQSGRRGRTGGNPLSAKLQQLPYTAERHLKRGLLGLRGQLFAQHSAQSHDSTAAVVEPFDVATGRRVYPSLARLFGLFRGYGLAWLTQKTPGESSFAQYWAIIVGMICGLVGVVGMGLNLCWVSPPKGRKTCWIAKPHMHPWNHYQGFD